MAKKFVVKRFYPQGVAIIDEAEVEGNAQKIVEVLFAENARCDAISLEPKEGHGRMQALKHNPKYYRSPEVLSLTEAAKKSTCAAALRQCKPDVHKALVRYREGYVPLFEGDAVFDLNLKRIWPKECMTAHTSVLSAVIKGAGRK